MIEEYPKSLKILAQQRYLGGFLDPGSRNMLIERAKSLDLFLRGRGRRPLEWSITIPLDHPLRFAECTVDDMALLVDVAFQMQGVENESIEIKKQSALVRVWSRDEEVSYRDGIDSSTLRNRLELAGWNRVILRFHFDLRGECERCREPLFHLQVGGDARKDEYCWMPKKMRVPRFPYHPLDVILLSEFILLNFFPEKSESLRKKPEWKSLVRKSQKMFLKPYVTTCLRHINAEDETLLGRLVS